ncbi:MAG: type III secretion system export apparatus subunit SctT [Puniceicoccales bacterium]|jgi:type III secretion protein T|nr:type III secretion system export apparatus subunit SctT [Puniceicoccales bacterium]
MQPEAQFSLQGFFYEGRAFFFMLVFGILRISSVFAVLPFFGKKNVLGMGRNSWILGISIFIYPIFSVEFPNPDIPLLAICFLGIKEIAIGTILGFLGAFIFFVVEGVGNLIDVQRGASAASLFSAFNESQTTVTADFFVQIVLLMFFLTGGFPQMLSIIYQTYVVWPVFSFVPHIGGGLAYYFVDFLSRYMDVVFALVGPILFALFLAEFGLGMVNRFAPQMNVFFLSMGIKSGLSNLFLILYMSYLIGFFTQHFFAKNKMLEFFMCFWR